MSLFQILALSITEIVGDTALHLLTFQLPIYIT